MSIKYEIHSIENSEGTGEERHFARIFEQKPMAAEQLKEQIQVSCSLTKGDVEGTLSALRAMMIRELTSGNRFYIPSIGYFSLSADLDMPDGRPIDKVRAGNIRVRNIKFRPDASMLRAVKSGVRFERSEYTTKSRRYTEDELWRKIGSHIAANGFITRRVMELQFGLGQYAALKWLRHFTDKGLLVKKGAPNSPVYFAGGHNHAPQQPHPQPLSKGRGE